MEFTIDQLLTLREVVRDGSFSRAAHRRHLSQPAVSHHIRALEKRAGVALLERLGKKAVPTEAGRVLLEHAGRALDELASAADKLRALRGEIAGPFRLGT